MSENIFDARGLLRADLENVQVAPDRRPLFKALVVAVRASEEAERTLKIRDDAAAEAIKLYDCAVAAQPRRTFLDEWKAMTGKRVPSSVEPVGGRASPVSAGRVEARPPYIVVREAEDKLGIARQELREARQAAADARAEIAKRLADYNASVPIISREQNVREFIASSNHERAQRAAGLIPPRAYRGGISQVDRMASAMAGGSGHGSRAGGGAAYKRGGVSLAEASRLNAQRARAIAAAKVKA